MGRGRAGATGEKMRKEVSLLAEKYGQPVVINLELKLEARKLFDPVKFGFAEVIPVIQRHNGKIILITKEFYPRGIWRLPTGQLEKGERILDGVRREAYEETGLKTHIARFLAVINLHVKVDRRALDYSSYVFLLKETGGRLRAVDEHERISGYKEVPISRLPSVANKLREFNYPLSKGLNLKEWGKFRAIAHDVVYEQLRREK